MELLSATLRIEISSWNRVCVCVCVCVCVRARAHAWACVIVCVCVCVGAGKGRTCGWSSDITAVQQQGDKAGGAMEDELGEGVGGTEESGFVQTGRIN